MKKTKERTKHLLQVSMAVKTDPKAAHWIFRGWHIYTRGLCYNVHDHPHILINKALILVYKSEIVKQEEYGRGNNISSFEAKKNIVALEMHSAIAFLYDMQIG